MKLKKVFLYLIGALLVLVVAYELVLYRLLNFDNNYFAIDRCLDSGGCWDKVDKTCRKDEENAQYLCARDFNSTDF